ncbi:MAG: hypothetical protein HC879_05345 [Leptolyngbyaceae cyanobacterium SL_5_9]|nr:hypothetical protein [Leptolyngbyaceae cyanobacterium SM1_4_3]NJN56951.1 hypothetical protein [Leptolyngbyaceae cyanobacterium SL_5_9]NJO75151.1 hypothetical protein [Leptolyngbyaceae cyanobacterium RM1_406_9]
MKRLSTRSKGQASFISWMQYIGMVLAFIGLWQLLSGGVTFLHYWF